ncbi:sulfate adenylyltransferase [Campylobacter pinnipediorum]|uniref:Sulfate adenylyltransferase n=1 Tax=Campylobacter pinnipediorum subsp. pinnipediorum TaxID=1660067 RepID=A0AAX0LAL7_9BACT|nr:sulfate adenylyltransferase [Campylobacter pinnipediorum]AQW81312.1 sulfate adenylyltransferase [Campylobacter pinnipediorum subsp. pinnipediorum]AQW82942.1 sulfate adenylyltransferase [Campylobacter pinnipediorum subsp. pinnipediorum]AQW84567.1 sulfate adenylyltransferase [Campylobacter pinnipediorum subsp. pinnipediorum]OPA77282.1 sulfate adenylyltransferase [Campylobacter pinnipediorum subsp. pinnipediorum]OPA78209.1 sulfate adenylyltransferase [Campylobacter pinnipediorum subsp. pinnipe
MKSQRKSKSINIDLDIFYTLELIQNKIFSKFNKLMNEKEIESVSLDGYFMQEPMPYPFIFSVDMSDSDLKNIDKLELICENKNVGYINIETFFKNKKEYELNIFNTRLNKNKDKDKWCVSGSFEIYSNEVKNAKKHIENIKHELNTQKITAVMLTADPINRAHERLIRMAIDKADLVIIFLLQSHGENSINFELRQETIEYFIQNYLPKNRVVIMPFKTSIFTLHQNPVLECISACNLGVNKLVIGQNHHGIGMFYDQNQPKTVLDKYIKDLNMDVIVLPELVYCDKCKTIVSTKTCPHGQHHHIKYHPETIKSLLFNGIMPPAILIRSDISAIILSNIFKNRFKDIQTLCDELFPNSGLLEKRTECDFYKELMRLYQTSSLT